VWLLRKGLPLALLSVKVMVYRVKQMKNPLLFSHRLATLEDLPELHTLMALSIRQLVGAFLDAEQVEASFDVMGVDTNLIIDGSYFVVEQDNKIIGCGGWSRRATLFGGDHTSGRDERLLDPASEPARVRAMYTHPDHARKGIGRFILTLCEDAAKNAGFSTLELMSTAAGEPLYSAYGFNVVERTQKTNSKGVHVPLTRMSKLISKK
jgi:GNAT superfamily N-acetyltransferase